MVLNETRIPICPACHSDDIVVDADIRWENGKWVLNNTFDSGYCYNEGCGEFRSHDWVAPMPRRQT